MSKKSRLIQDPHFRVDLCPYSSSPQPEKGIWYSQHLCVAENYPLDDHCPIDPGNAIINHQFKPGHWDVLGHAYVKLYFGGFPHDTAMQMRTHQQTKGLTQSMRYTGERFRAAIDNPSLLESLFYYPPEGSHPSRDGIYHVTEHIRNRYFERVYDSVVEYIYQVDHGIPEESARRVLASGYRQNFVMAGHIQSVFHWLDRRTLADTQIECRTAAYMALDELKEWSPTFFEWYEENRANINKLAP